MGWKLQDDPTKDDNSWTDSDPLNAKEEDDSWVVKPNTLNPNVSELKFGVSGFAGYAIEELDIYPEDLDLAPEDIQADAEDWTIQNEPN